MHRLLKLLPLLLLLPTLALAQVDARIADTRTPLSDVPALVMPVLDNAALLATELANRAPGRAPRFAETFSVEATPATHGHWETLPNGNEVWRLRVKSATALSLNLGFTKFFMPPGSTLILYDAVQKQVMGPFTPADNEEHEQLWTPVLPGEELVIEVQLPAQRRAQLQLKLSSVNHDFIGFASVASGSCNLDVICGAADGWAIVDGYRDIIQSVAVISTGGGTFCTGFLVNSTRNDCTPFFMTANHCGINANNAASLVTYWNYQNSVCRQPNTPQSGGNGNGQLNNFNTGSIFRASYAPSDMTLVELDDPVSPTSNAFFAGWSAEIIAPSDTVIAIHHPSTDEKRISFEFDPTYFTNGISQTMVPNGSHIVVPDWDIGTTEGGSSGSPLFNNQKQVVGQLHGGGAACGNNSFDSYGGFYRSWTGGGGNNNSLRPWLDPDNTGVLSIDGRSLQACSFFVDVPSPVRTICAPEELSYTVSVSENFTDSVQLSLQDLPDGLTASFAENPVVPGSSTQLTITGTENLLSGSYSSTLSGNDGTNTSNITNLVLNISAGLPTTSTLLSPADEEEGLTLSPVLSWAAQTDAGSYDVEVATDEAFTDIVGNGTGLSATTFSGLSLVSQTDYFWRVRANNTCGTGEWSQAFRFKTAAIICTDRSAEGLPIAISASGTPTITSMQELSVIGNVSDVRVTGLNILHSWVGDLTVRLTSPAGTTAILFQRPGAAGGGFGCNGDNVLVDIYDAAPNTAADLQGACGNLPAIAGAYQPQQPLAVFAGEPASGVWTLTVNDAVNQDGGSLVAWNLELCTTIPNTASVNPDDSDFEICANGSVDNIGILVGTGFDGDEITLGTADLPEGATATFSENPIAPGGFATVSVSGLPEGDYSFLITGTDGTDTASTPIFVLASGAPPAAVLNTPANAAIDIPTGTGLTWAAVPGATAYTVTLATDPALANVVVSNTQPGLSFNTSGLTLGQTYYWSVATISPCGSTLSEVRSFTVIPDLAFGFTPGSPTACLSGQMNFSVNIGPGFGENITITHSLNAGGNVVVAYPSGTSAGGSFPVVVSSLFNLAPGNYVLTFNITDGVYTRMATVNMVVRSTPAQPNLNNPMNDFVTTGNFPFSWLAVPSATNYTVDIADNDAFVNPVSVNTSALTTPFEAAAFMPGTYFWRVTAINECGGTSSAPRSFVYAPTSTEELNGRQLALDPNPTTGNVRVQLSAPATGSLRVAITDINGRHLQEQRFDAGQQNLLLDLGEYPAGVYLLRFTEGSDHLTKRVVVQR